MKKYFYIFIGMFLLLAFSDGGVDITIDVQHSDNKTSNIIITVLQGEPGFSYYLCDKEPWAGGTIIKEKGPVANKFHIFKNINPGTYFVAVRDKNKSLKGEYVTIENKDIH